MKQKKIKLTRDMACRWSYEDEDFEKGCMTSTEAIAMFIARFAATIQAMDDKNEELGIEIVLKRC